MFGVYQLRDVILVEWFVCKYQWEESNGEGNEGGEREIVIDSDETTELERKNERKRTKKNYISDSEIANCWKVFFLFINNFNIF